MAAKKNQPPKPSPVEQAVADIKRRYPATAMEFRGVKSPQQAVQQFQDVVSESGLVDKYNTRTLMAAAAKVANQRFVSSQPKRGMRAK